MHIYAYASIVLNLNIWHRGTNDFRQFSLTHNFI